MADSARLDPVRLDYRRQFWGHACTITRTGADHESGAPMYSGHIFASMRKPKVGTQVLLNMASGRPAVFELTDVEWCRDPDDMYRIKAYPRGYLDEIA